MDFLVNALLLVLGLFFVILATYVLAHWYWHRELDPLPVLVKPSREGSFVWDKLSSQNSFMGLSKRQEREATRHSNGESSSASKKEKKSISYGSVHERRLHRLLRKKLRSLIPDSRLQDDTFDKDAVKNIVNKAASDLASRLEVLVTEEINASATVPIMHSTADADADAGIKDKRHGGAIEWDEEAQLTVKTSHDGTNAGQVGVGGIVVSPQVQHVEAHLSFNVIHNTAILTMDSAFEAFGFGLGLARGLDKGDVDGRKEKYVGEVLEASKNSPHHHHSRRGHHHDGHSHQHHHSAESKADDTKKGNEGDKRNTNVAVVDDDGVASVESGAHAKFRRDFRAWLGLDRRDDFDDGASDVSSLSEATDVVHAQVLGGAPTPERSATEKQKQQNRLQSHGNNSQGSPRTHVAYFSDEEEGGDGAGAWDRILRLVHGGSRPRADSAPTATGRSNKNKDGTAHRHRSHTRPEGQRSPSRGYTGGSSPRSGRRSPHGDGRGRGRRHHDFDRESGRGRGRAVENEENDDDDDQYLSDSDSYDSYGTSTSEEEREWRRHVRRRRRRKAEGRRRRDDGRRSPSRKGGNESQPPQRLQQHESDLEMGIHVKPQPSHGTNRRVGTAGDDNQFVPVNSEPRPAAAVTVQSKPTSKTSQQQQQKQKQQQQQSGYKAVGQGQERECGDEEGDGSSSGSGSESLSSDSDNWEPPKGFISTMKNFFTRFGESVGRNSANNSISSEHKNDNSPKIPGKLTVVVNNMQDQFISQKKSRNDSGTSRGKNNADSENEIEKRPSEIRREENAKIEKLRRHALERLSGMLQSDSDSDWTDEDMEQSTELSNKDGTFQLGTALENSTVGYA